MSLRFALFASIVAGSCLYTVRASAENASPANSALAPAYTETSAPQRRWYGWQTLSLDAASLSIGVIGVARRGEPGPTGIVLGSLGFTGYAFGAPLVHWLHDQPGKAAASLGLRVGLPLIAVGLVSANSGGRCPDGLAHEGDDYCGRMLRTMEIVGALSMLAASAIDASAVSWEPEVHRQKLALAPLLGWDGAGGGVAGLVGAF